jgi:hypothetical protein
MKIILPLLAVMLSVPCVLTGCQPPKPASPSVRSAPQSTRNNCCSLLHQLLDDQTDISMLRFIKREHSNVKNLYQEVFAMLLSKLK